MVAAPQYGTIILLSADGRQTRSVDIYVSDVVAALVNFDEGQGATSTSKTEYIAPSNCVIKDVIFETGLTDTSVYQLTVNGSPTGDWLRAIVQDDGNERPKLTIPVAKGSAIGLIQRA